jgi:hypothetical protein
MSEKSKTSERIGPEQIDFKEFADHGAFRTPPRLFDQRASLSIAKWILCVFAGVLVLAFMALFVMISKQDAILFEKVAELIKFLVQAVVPLVTLAVGYYLGDRGRSNSD